ncbi:hypothetical protein [Metabacillus fastidiosus]|uniref:hypothetical protein n=1 Tax=Metabacillus fastidiosus TaxID=1458 RepID=UPI003D27CC81
MAKLGDEFSRFIENIYRRHDKIQTKEEEKIKKIAQDLQALELTANQFEQKMEQAAFHIEEWIKNREN